MRSTLLTLCALVFLQVAQASDCANVICYNTLNNCLNGRAGVPVSGTRADCEWFHNYYACASDQTKCREKSTGLVLSIRDNDCHQGIRCYKSFSDCLNGIVATSQTGPAVRSVCLPYDVFSCREVSPYNCQDVETGYEIKQGAGAQDPHFRGFDGTEYYFEGLPGYSYNILSTKELQLNAYFVMLADLKGTYMGQLGVLFPAGEPLVFDPNFGVFFNGTLVSEREVIVGGNAFHVEQIDGRYRLTIQTPAFEIVARAQLEKSTKSSVYINLQVTLTGEPGLTHGILGQTVAFRHLGPGRFKLEGEEDDYRVRDGLLGIQFKYNLYGNQ